MAEANRMPAKEKVTLILDENRFQVNKEKLLAKSKYFATLFSHNFSDSKNNEQHVRYDVEPSILQDFCNFIEEDACTKAEAIRIKVALQKFLGINEEMYAALKQLLKLGIFYHVDELCTDICDLIISHWLNPKFLLDIWKLCKETSPFLEILKDVIFAACLYYFQELPVRELLTMPRTDLFMLLSNYNVKSSEDYLSYIATERLKKEEETTKTVDSTLRQQIQKFLNFIPKPHRKPSYMYCIYGETDFCCNLRRMVYTIKKKDPILFEELIDILKPDGSERELIGLGVVGRDFSIYKIGGEKKIGSGNFVMDIWRYCLLTKKLYCLARLRQPRRHMAVALVADKLILIGGVGRYRIKCSNVEILDLKTGLWIGPSVTVPEEFTDVPPTCVMNDIVILCISNIYMFNPALTTWISVVHDIDLQEFRNVTCLTSYRDILFIGKENCNFVGYKVIWEIVAIQGGGMHVQGARLCKILNKEFSCNCQKLHLDHLGEAIGVAVQHYYEGSVLIEHGSMDPATCLLQSDLSDFEQPCDNIIPHNFFTLIDPATLYKQLPI